MSIPNESPPKGTDKHLAEYLDRMFREARLADQAFHSIFRTSWDDLRFPAQGINPPGQVSDPAREATTGLLLFGASGTETIAGVAQMPHDWKEGSILGPHVHWQKTVAGAGDVVWQLDYEVVPNGDIATMGYTSQLQSNTIVPQITDDNSANRLLVTDLGEMTMVNKKISCCILWKLSRVGGDAADTYASDARLVEFDIHYQRGQLGSTYEYSLF